VDGPGHGLRRNRTRLSFSGSRFSLGSGGIGDRVSRLSNGLHDFVIAVGTAMSVCRDVLAQRHVAYGYLPVSGCVLLW
jgi:hypothetical protein